MYVISGKLKGKKLTNPKSKSVRPAMALVRKSIFDTLGSLVEDANVLDLCAGTGSLGLEAISRGAKKLTLVDSDDSAIKTIFKNLEFCKVKARVIKGKLPLVLYRKNLEKEKFDLIFLDPPYGQGDFIEELLKVLAYKKILAKEGLILIETEKKCRFELPEKLEVYKEKIYGNTKVTFLSS